MTESRPVSTVHSSSVMNGMTGCSNRSSASSTNPSTCRVTSAARSSAPPRGILASSRYQSQNSSHAKWYSASQALPNSKRSNSSSTSAATADSRDSIQRSGTDSDPASGSSPGTRAPLPSAKRAAFHSLLQKFLDPAAQSSLT